MISNIRRGSCSISRAVKSNTAAMASNTVPRAAAAWHCSATGILHNHRGHAPGVGSLLFLVSPLAVSLLLRAFAGDGWKDLGINPRLSKNLLWYLASLLMYPIVTLVVVLIDFGLGTITLPASGFTTGMFLGAFTIAVGPMLLKDVFEEVGWRGYLTPKLLKLRYPPLAMHIVRSE